MSDPATLAGELAWLTQAPPLITPPPGCDSADAILRQCAGEPGVLRRAAATLVEQPRPRRLGLHFENLVAAVLQHSQRYRLVARNVPLRLNGNTLGELDMLVEDRDTGDLMSAGVQDQSYGMSLRFGPVKAGIHHKSAEGRDMGLRQGYVDRFQSESFVALILGSDILKGPLPQEGPDQSKPDETREKSNGPAATEDRKPSGGQNIDGPS
ncbi:MAG: hypothetical protein CL543_00430, partial [Alcanivorax sp.]|nr:hypothetical protein [Alcanivorax sp.]